MTTPVSKPKQPEKEHLLDRAARSKFVILAINFGVTGFLGLPLIWISPGFSRKEKWFWSIAVTLYTLVLIGIAVGAVLHALWTINEALAQ